jgi:uncharacterized protein YbdZ (MbtH family)
LGATEPERGGETARRDTSRAVLNFIGLILFVQPVPPEDKSAARLTTVLLPMQAGSVWRVQIVWPNGSVHYFGTFTSKEATIEWIKRHAWLTVQPKRPDDASE